MCLARMTRVAVGQERSMPAPRRQLVVVLSAIIQPTEKRTQAQTQAQLVTASTKNRVCRNLHCKPRKNNKHTVRKNRDRLSIDYQHISLHRQKTLRNRAVNLFRICVTQRTTEKKAVENPSVKCVSQSGPTRCATSNLDRQRPPSCHGLRNKRKAVSTQTPWDHTRKVKPCHRVSSFTPTAAPVGSSAKEVTPSTEKRPQNGGEKSCVKHFTKIAVEPAHCKVRDDGVPVLHVQPVRARLRQLRVVVQELEQDDDKVVTPRPDPRHCGHEQNKSANLVKRAA